MSKPLSIGVISTRPTFSVERQTVNTERHYPGRSNTQTFGSSVYTYEREDAAAVVENAKEWVAVALDQTSASGRLRIVIESD